MERQNKPNNNPNPTWPTGQGLAVALGKARELGRGGMRARPISEGLEGPKEPEGELGSGLSCTESPGRAVADGLGLRYITHLVKGCPGQQQYKRH